MSPHTIKSNMNPLQQVQLRQTTPGLKRLIERNRLKKNIGFSKIYRKSLQKLISTPPSTQQPFAVTVISIWIIFHIILILDVMDDFVVVVSAGSGINDPPLCVFSLFKIIILRGILRRLNKKGAHHFLCRIKNNPPTPCKTASFRQQLLNNPCHLINLPSYKF